MTHFTLTVVERGARIEISDVNMSLSARLPRLHPPHATGVFVCLRLILLLCVQIVHLEINAGAENFTVPS